MIKVKQKSQPQYQMEVFDSGEFRFFVDVWCTDFLSFFPPPTIPFGYTLGTYIIAMYPNRLY